MMKVLRCFGCKKQIIVSEHCSAFCSKCHMQMQFDPRETKEQCGKENEKEHKVLEKERETLKKKELKLNKKNSRVKKHKLTRARKNLPAGRKKKQ